MDLLIEHSQLAPGSNVLDVGCGIGGTARYLAQNYGCTVTGINISGRQVEMANSLTADAALAFSLYRSNMRPSIPNQDLHLVDQALHAWLMPLVAFPLPFP